MVIIDFQVSTTNTWLIYGKTIHSVSALFFYWYTFDVNSLLLWQSTGQKSSCQKREAKEEKKNLFQTAQIKNECHNNKALL